ncbi:MAG: N-acetylmuramoyl-L-alanine amidase [bacterium]|nr:N-acetylmuramoyl-L-alanine amidase [bacterium]
MIIRSWCIWVFMVVNLGTLNAAQLNNISISQQIKKTTLYLSIDGAFTHRVFVLNNPNRVVIDLSTTQLKTDLRQLNLINGPIKQVRSGLPNAKTLRLVFEVNQPLRISSSPWQPAGSLKGVRIDMVGGSATLSTHLDKPATRDVTVHPTAKLVKIKSNQGVLIKEPVIRSSPALTHQTPIKVSHSPSRVLRNVVVVLDAGHGGKDPGARGPRNSKEKNVVLEITLKLKQLIDKQPGMRAVLTRSGDYYVGLRQRLDIARKYNGDIFVSIHADAFNNPHSNGASVFALSQSGATSEAARWIAEKENYSELGGVNLGDLDDTNGVVRSVLIDLSQTATISAGLQMGGRVLSQLDNFTRLHNNKVEQARFMVLKSPDIPSILVETGFISNPVEEKNLNSYAYQKKLSQAIFQGIKGYFWDNPPPGTRIEAMVSNRFHIVRSGETLPVIASRYRVSVVAMQAVNHLPNVAVRPGQKLVIPSAWA